MEVIESIMLMMIRIATRKRGGAGEKRGEREGEEKDK